MLRLTVLYNSCMNGQSAFKSFPKVLHLLCFVTDIKTLTPHTQPTKNKVETTPTFSSLAMWVHKIQADGIHLAPDSKLKRNKG